jgi:two-component system chemotaxis sensor kinase CheA
MPKDPYQYFRIEGRELLDQLGRGVLDLAKQGSAPDLVATMLRLAHTLKGAARVVKQRQIAEGAHAIETALGPFRDPGGVLTPAALQATQQALDEIGRQLATLAPQRDAAEPRAQRSEVVLDGPALIDPISANAEEMDAILDGLREASAQLSGLRRGIGRLQQGRHLIQRLESAGGSSRSGASDARSGSAAAQLRDLLESTYRDSAHAVDLLERELVQAQEASERLRLLPVRLLFVPLERVALDAAAGLGKRIRFLASGGDIRLDAQVLGWVQRALVQVVRNAVAHGIETPAERELAGKPAEGRVSVEVRRRGYQVEFDCRDDGRGIDLDAVRRAVSGKGSAGQGAGELDSDALIEALLAGGISTSRTVSQHAGRGIGLDVVSDAADRLRGKVQMSSDPGSGVRLQLLVPVTLAALDAILVRAASSVVAIPLEAVKRTLRIGREEIAESAEGASIVYEGKVIPFAPLERALATGSGTAATARAWSTVIVEGANALAAVGVERLCGTQNILLRPLPAHTPCDPIVAGASFDNEGQPQLVLDPEGLIQRVRRIVPASAILRRRAPILVIDDSLTTRMLEQSILESAGYQVDLATSGEEALERAAKAEYALFLVDVEMPGMDGFTFIERTRQDPALRHVPAILVTSRGSVEDRRRGREVGARAYIVKGEFDQTELLQQIRGLVATP